MHIVVSSPQVTVLEHSDGSMAIEPLAGAEKRLRVRPKSGLKAARLGWTTRYPLDLIHEIFATKGLYICDEIMREEDPRYVEHFLRTQVLTYVPASAFAGKRVLDFGCGSGASTVVLSRLLPRCEIVGIELEERLLRIARLRAMHFGLPSATFLRSPRGDQLPEGLGMFDFIMFSAVFEHLLPEERQALLPLVFSHLKPGGVLFLNQTPHRYSPVEMHTTHGLPFINYLPDRLTLAIARRFSKYVRPTDDWQKLLRLGIRGGTVREIMRIIRRRDRATLLRPIDGDRVDQWYRGLSKRHDWLKRSLWLSLKALKLVTRIELTPALALAIRKDP
jgi:2-polyprenyl-3-methyl-5-hydroxy-6-metoxy-1,4-benzoquinol methylase